MLTRYLVKSGYEERQIFAVRDLGRSGISIIFKTKSGQFGDRMIDNVKDFHISVHTEQYHDDRKVLGYRVKHSLIDVDGDYYWGSIIVKKRNNRPMVWCVVNAFSSILFGEGFKFSNKKDDKFVRVIGYLGMGETLVYSIYVVDKSVEMPQIQGFGIITQEFSCFNVVLYFAFFHMPSGKFSLNDTISRGALRKGRNPSVIIGGAQDPVPFDPQSNDRASVRKYLIASHIRLSSDFMKILSSNSDIVPSILKTEHQRPKFSRWPLDNDEIHRAYGEGSVLNNPKFADPDGPDGQNGTPRPPWWIDPSELMMVRPNTNESLAKHGVNREDNLAEYWNDDGKIN